MDLRKWGYTAAAGLTLTFASISGAQASVPEIDAGSGTAAIALLVGVLFLAGERLRRRAS